MAKKYSLNVDNDQVVSIEVDGVVYDHPDQIPDPQDRRKILELISDSEAESFDADFERGFEDFDAEFRELERQSARFPGLIAAIFLGIAALTLAIALVSGFSAARRLAAEQPAPGRVVELTLRASQGGYDDEGNYQPPQDYYYPVVAFSLPNGERKTVQLSEGSWPAAYEVGEEVTVRYNPDRPLDARIQSTSSDVLMWLLPGITGVLGVIFALVAGMVFWFTRPAEQGANAG